MKQESWDFRNDDEIDFLQKILKILHVRYQDEPPVTIVITAWIIQKRMEEIDGPQISDTNWRKGDLN